MSQALVRLERLLPSLLMATGVMLLTVGALSYAPTSLTASRTASPVTGDPLFSGTGTLPSPTPASSTIELAALADTRPVHLVTTPGRRVTRPNCIPGH